MQSPSQVLTTSAPTSPLVPGSLFYRIFHDSSVGMVFTTVAEGRYVEVNAAFARMLGYDRDELLRQPFTLMGLNNEEERAMVLDVLQRRGKLGDVPLILYTRDAVARACLASVQLEEIGGEAYFIFIIQDLTAHEQARTALQLAENRFRLFFQSIPLPLVVVDEADGRVLDVNDAACRTFGYSYEEFIHLFSNDLMPADEIDDLWLVESASHNGDASGRAIAGRRRLKDGTVIDVDVLSYSFRLEGRRARLSIVRDVTEERAIETALRSSEERLRIIADVTTDAIWERDMQTDEVAWSSGLETLFGYAKDEHRPHNWWLNHVHPDERAGVEASIEAQIGSQDDYWTAEYRFLRADGTYANVLDRGYVIREPDGRPVKFIGAMVDITTQLQMAQAVAHAALVERQRLSRDLHDSVTQSLYSVSLMAEAARRRADAGEREMTVEFIGRLGLLSQQALRQLRLLVYELRPSMLEQEGLTEALRHRLEAVERRAGLKVQLVHEGDAVIPPALEADLFRVAQEALNNSLKYASADAVTVHLRVNEDEIVLEISDNGHGFDRTATTEDVGGLATIRRRVTSLGGELSLLATPGGGATVRARVPGNA
jgi:PAS domain S-box-containing protein